MFCVSRFSIRIQVAFLSVSYSQLVLGMLVPLLLVIVLIGITIWMWLRWRRCANPFERDETSESKPLVTDQKARDAVLKQSFSADKVPQQVDAIVVGSGVAALGLAATLSKCDWKVLVLEQHDQAGGCCHTFIDRGYEFDVGVHYIGGMNWQSPLRVLVDQLTAGQLQWASLDDVYDVAVFGDRRYSFVSGRQRWADHLKQQFPGYEGDVDRLVARVRKAGGAGVGWVLVKYLPFWLSQLLIQTGLVNWITYAFTGNQSTVQQVVQAETSNKDLQAAFMYCFGDYGTAPDRAGFPIHAALLSHFWDGASYPVGGASEVAFHMIPVIERAGGRVLVKASVTEILMDQLRSKVCGVRVKKGSSYHDIHAPVVVSNAGVCNTFKDLLPRTVASSSRLWPLTKLPPAAAGFSVFVGIDAPLETIRGEGQSEIVSRNWWVFASNNIVDDCNKFLSLPMDEAIEQGAPLLFISFPSAKDPQWDKRYPGKSAMALVTLCNDEWFRPWLGEPCMKRGADYEAIKSRLAQRLLDRACDMFPQIRAHIDYIGTGSSLTNAHYLAAAHGEIYGLDHTQRRFDAEHQTLLRAGTDIPGLYLTGQDVVSCGFVGALMGGVLTASALLKRNVFFDVDALWKKMRKSK